MLWNSFKSCWRLSLLTLIVLLSAIISTTLISKSANALDLSSVSGYVKVDIPPANIESTNYTLNLTLYDVTSSSKVAVDTAMTTYDPNKFRYSFDGTLPPESGEIFTGLIDGHKYQVCIDKVKNNKSFCSEVYTVDAKASGSVVIDVILSGEKDYESLPSTPIPASDTSKSACILKGVGWIVCPGLNFIAAVTDSSYEIVKDMLITPSLNTDTGPDNTTYAAWGIMRSIANVAFVISFLVIIFSQLSGAGITNYGVKKMLPRLVIAVILVNISYFICAILVDMSNIGGVSLKQLFDSIGGQLSSPEFEKGTGWVVIASSILSGAYLLYAGLAVLIPALAAAFLAIVVVFLVLTVRQALIILLIVISPIAFVAFLLPNTEELFKKWRSLFVALLLLFPIISVIFGASALASKIVIGSGDDPTVQIMGALITVVPLFLTPIIMKSAGGALGKVSGMITNSGIMKGAQGAANRYSDDYQKRRDTRLNNEAMNTPGGKNPFKRFRRASIQRTARIEAVDQNQQRELGRARTGYIADATADNIGGLRDQMAAGGGAGALNRAITSAESTRSKLEDSEIADSEALFRGQNTPDNLVTNAGNELQNAIKSGDTIKASAMQKILLSSGGRGISQLHSALEAAESHTAPDGTRTANLATMTSLKRGISNAGIKGKHAVLDNWSRSTQSLGEVADTKKIYAGLSAVELAGQDINILKNVQAKNLIEASQAGDIINNKNVFQNLDEAHKTIFKELAPQAPPQPSPILDQHGNPIIQ